MLRFTQQVHCSKIEFRIPNVECRMSNVECRMSAVDVHLLIAIRISNQQVRNLP
jgi:hypothetical protein